MRPQCLASALEVASTVGAWGGNVGAGSPGTTAQRGVNRGIRPRQAVTRLDRPPTDRFGVSGGLTPRVPEVCHKPGGVAWEVRSRVGRGERAPLVSLAYRPPVAEWMPLAIERIEPVGEPTPDRVALRSSPSSSEPDPLWRGFFDSAPWKTTASRLGSTMDRP